MDIKKAVARGAKFLDAVYPGWEKDIDVDSLNQVIGDRCVLGQLFLTRQPIAASQLSYSTEAYLTHVKFLSLTSKELKRRGFKSSYSYPVNVDEHNQLWVEQINERKTPDPEKNFITAAELIEALQKIPGRVVVTTYDEHKGDYVYIDDFSWANGDLAVNLELGDIYDSRRH